MPKEKLKACCFVFWCLHIYHQKVVFCDTACGPQKDMFVDEGDDMTLQIDRSPITYITWNFERHLIATTKPGRQLEPGEHIANYSGRLSSLDDGSLFIQSLSPKDERVYRAELYRKNWTYHCAQLYDLRIVGHIRSPPQIEGSSESCTSTAHSTIQLYYHLEENVTLPAPSRSDLGSILWDINNIDHLAVTKISENGANFVRLGRRYGRRLSTVKDGSLTMLGVTSDDRNVYRADLFEQDWSYVCTQIFDVQVAGSIPESSMIMNVIRLGLSACVLVITLIILIHHFKTEICAKKADSAP